MSRTAAQPSPSHYAALLDSVVDFAVIGTDLDGAITDWNSGATHIFGWGKEEVLGSGLGETIYTKEDQAAGRARLEMSRSLEVGRASDERWHVKKDGSRFWASGEVMPFRSETGAHVGFVKVLRDETRNRLAAETLREAKGLSGLILNSSRDCIVVLDLDGNNLSVSPGGLESMEIDDVDAILGLSWLRVWKGSDHVAAEDAIRAARAGGIGRFQGFCPTHKGNPKWWDVVVSPLPGPDGKPERLVSVGRDITERTVAENEFRLIAQAMPSHVWTATPDGMLDWLNDPVYAYSGAKPGELNGERWASMVHPDDLAVAAERWSAALATGSPYETEFRLRRADGVYRWHIARAQPIRRTDGAVGRWVGTNTDIDDERRAQANLAELNATLEHRVAERTRERDGAWNNSRDLLAVFDLQGNFQAVNAAWTDILGWEASQLIGAGHLEFIYPDDHDESEAGLRQAATSSVQGYENRYRHRDGGFRWISWVASHEGKSIYASGRHITAEREAADALAAAQEQLRQAQKMEAVGQLTGGIAHDFNNILQVVSGNLQLLHRLAPHDEPFTRRIATAEEAVRRGAKLSSQLLAFSRQQPLQPKVVHAGRFLGSIEDMLRRALGEAIEVELVVSGGLWNTLVDPAQLEHALLNLAINARDAMDGHGKLTIEVGNASLDDIYARQRPDVTAGQYVMLAVTDTGRGMSAEVASRAFEPFFTTKAVGTGTGLGLSMVYGLIKQSGGHVAIYSEVGHGTTVKLYLPRVSQQEDPVAAPETMSATGGNETILVAEDDAGVRATVVDLLRELGYKVLQAKDAASAFTVIESGAAIDMLFTDVVMPGPMKSTELARLARLRLPQLVVLFTSGYTQNAIVHGGRLDVGVDLLAKPYTREGLARKIREVLLKRPGAREVQAATASEARIETAEAPRRDPILLVEDNEAIRLSTAELLTDLGHEVLQADSAEDALVLLKAGHVRVLITDLGLPGMSGDVLAMEARRLQPDVQIIFCSGRAAVPPVLDGAPCVLLRKPFDIEALTALLDR